MADTDAGLAEGYMGFVGVTTQRSSIMKVFPIWAEILGLPTRTLIGHDLALDSPPESYRALLSQIRDDPRHFGALVTTHKMNIYAACADMFDEVDEFGTTAGEVSSISKRGGKLRGAGRDALTVGRALEEFLPAGHFGTGAHAVSLGAGGSGTALTWYLAQRSERPQRIWVTGRHQDKLDRLRVLMERSGAPSDLVCYVRDDTADGSRTAELLEQVPEGSLIANATGLGKDRPGSPVPEDALFPRHALAWEFNYRGSLEFLHQANAQAQARELTVIDGWRYFVHGWTTVIADVFGIELTPSLLDELSQAALTTRS